MTPTVSPFRVGTFIKDGIKLRHDFELNAEENQLMQEAMEGIYINNVYHLPLS